MYNIVDEICRNIITILWSHKTPQITIILPHIGRYRNIIRLIFVFVFVFVFVQTLLPNCGCIHATMIFPTTLHRMFLSSDDDDDDDDDDDNYTSSPHWRLRKYNKADICQNHLLAHWTYCPCITSALVGDIRCSGSIFISGRIQQNQCCRLPLFC